MHQRISVSPVIKAANLPCWLMRSKQTMSEIESSGCVRVRFSYCPWDWCISLAWINEPAQPHSLPFPQLKAFGLWGCRRTLQGHTRTCDCCTIGLQFSRLQLIISAETDGPGRPRMNWLDNASDLPEGPHRGLQWNLLLILVAITMYFGP